MKNRKLPLMTAAVCALALVGTVFAETITDLGAQVYSASGFSRAITGQTKFEIGHVEMAFRLKEHEYTQVDCNNFLPGSTLTAAGWLFHSQTPISGYPKFVKDAVSKGTEAGGTVQDPFLYSSVGYEGKLSGFTEIVGGFEYWGMERKERNWYVIIPMTRTSTLPAQDGGPFGVVPVSTPPPMTQGDWISTMRAQLCRRQVVVCGDALCDASENSTTCPSDCMASSSSSSSSMPSCNMDTICDAGEDMTCTDCMASSSSSSSSTPSCNMDTVCDAGEDMTCTDCMASSSSSSSMGPMCGDAMCDTMSGETSVSCPADCF